MGSEKRDFSMHAYVPKNDCEGPSHDRENHCHVLNMDLNCTTWLGGHESKSI